jgi:ArsR family transcriptional regulator
VDKKIYEMHAEMCQVFTSPKRLEIMYLLNDKELSVGELVKKTKLPQANLSQHLTVLREKGIVKTRREGTGIYYSLVNKKIIKACSIMKEILFDKLFQDEKLAKEINSHLA